LFLTWQTGAKQETPPQQKRNETQSSSPTTPAQPPAKQEQGQPGQSKKCSWPPWSDPFWSNWALVVVTGFAVWIAFGTLSDLKEQTYATKESAEAAKTSADAALLNAQAAINADRPWIIVLLLQSKRNDRVWLNFIASNEGHSPAVIVSSFAQCAVINDPNSLSVPPNYGTELPKNVPLLMPNFGHDMSGSLIYLKEYAFDETVSREQLREIQNKTAHLVFWFKIIYTTHLAIETKIPPYETCYCCEFSPETTDFLKIVGPKEYNKYT